MGLYVVAEGVETKEQFELLKNDGRRCRTRLLYRCSRSFGHDYV